MLQTASLLAIVAVGTAENELSKAPLKEGGLGVGVAGVMRSSTWPPKSTDVREALFARSTLYRRIVLYTAAEHSILYTVAKLSIPPQFGIPHLPQLGSLARFTLSRPFFL